MLELGALLGALLAGTFTDRYSRRHSIFAACGMLIVSYSFLYPLFIVDLRFTHVSSLLLHNTTCLKNTHLTCDRHHVVVFIIGSAMQTLASSLEDLILGRAIGGIGIGALSMLSPLYMAEISPPELRGSLMSLEQFAIVLGVVLGFWTGFWTRDSKCSPLSSVLCASGRGSELVLV